MQDVARPPVRLVLGIERTDGIDDAQGIGHDGAADGRRAAPALARQREVDGVPVGAHPDIILRDGRDSGQTLMLTGNVAIQARAPRSTTHPAPVMIQRRRLFLSLVLMPAKKSTMA